MNDQTSKVLIELVILYLNIDMLWNFQHLLSIHWLNKDTGVPPNVSEMTYTSIWQTLPQTSSQKWLLSINSWSEWLRSYPFRDRCLHSKEFECQSSESRESLNIKSSLQPSKRHIKTPSPSTGQTHMYSSDLELSNGQFDYLASKPSSHSTNVHFIAKSQKRIEQYIKPDRESNFF